MKKLFIAAVVVASLGMSSCTTIEKTASVENINTEVVAAAKADLVVSEKKISFTYDVPKKERKAGNKNAVQCAVAEALKANGDADVLVAPQYVIKKRKGTVKTVTVTGYPATYKNFKVVGK